MPDALDRHALLEADLQGRPSASVPAESRMMGISGGHGATSAFAHPTPLRHDARSQNPRETLPMKMSSAIRVALVALTAFAGASLSSACHADSGAVSLTIYKAGWIIGGSGGGGTLNFRGRNYALSAGGLDYGLVFGGSKTVLRGRVSNIYRPSDVAGVYGAAGAGLAVGGGARAIVLTNQKGAVLELSGQQVGLMANVDLSGLAITLK
jgi:hypothetical protein